MPNLQLRAPHAVQVAVRHGRRDRLAGARASAPTRRSSRCSTRCCCGRCRCRSPSGWSTSRAPGPKPGSQSCNNAGDCDEVFSYPMFRDLEQRADRRSPASPRIASSARTSPISGQTTERRRACWSRAATSRCSACSPALGRLLGAGRRPRSSASRTSSVLSHGYWQTRFGAESRRAQRDDDRQRPDDDDRRRRAARASTGRRSASQPQVFVPITLRGADAARASRASTTARSYWAYLFARLKPGVTIEQAQRGAQRAVSRDRQRRRGAAPEGHERRRRWRGSGPSRSRSTPGARGQSTRVARSARRR